MNTTNHIQISGDYGRIFDLAADIARWPEILPHYRWVKILEKRPGSDPSATQPGARPPDRVAGGSDPIVVAEMAARHKGLPLWWKAIQRPLKEERRIHFTHIGGITKGMEVEWTFEEISSSPFKGEDGGEGWSSRPPQTPSLIPPFSLSATKPWRTRRRLNGGEGRRGTTPVWLVQIHHQFEPEWPAPGPWLAERVIGEMFVKQVANKTLRRIKEIVES